MKTRTRRFLLRLIVALLTFLIGVFAVVVLGRFNPSEGRHARPRFSRCGDRAWQALPPPPPPAVRAPDAAPPAPLVVRPVYRPQLESSAAPPAHQPEASPVPPSFEDEGEVKARKPDTSRSLQ
jgi:hypothetical protein